LLGHASEARLTINTARSGALLTEPAVRLQSHKKVTARIITRTRLDDRAV